VTLRLVGCIAVISAYFMLLRGMFLLFDKRRFMFNLGVGRYVNPSYKIFIEELFKVKDNPTQEARQVIKQKYQNKISKIYIFRIYYQNLIFHFLIGNLIIPSNLLLFVNYQ
jgi:hypothetical protein